MNKSREKRSAIWKIPSETLQTFLNESASMKEVLIKIGTGRSCGSQKTLADRLKTEELDLTKYKENKSVANKNNLLKNSGGPAPDDEVFCINSKYDNRNGIKKRMLKMGFNYECKICKITEYNNKPISLQLDHINGVNNDSRLENLRFLCPNCHSQTETFSGRNLPKKNKKICTCGSTIKDSVSMCRKCFSKLPKKSKIVWPSPESLQKLLWEKPTIQIADELGVSDKAVEKHAKKHSLNKPPRGYWQKGSAT